MPLVSPTAFPLNTSWRRKWKPPLESMVSCIVPLTLTVPDTTSPVHSLKKLKGKVSENLILKFSACTYTEVGNAMLVINIDTKILLKSRLLSVFVVSTVDMTNSPLNRFFLDLLLSIYRMCCSNQSEHKRTICALRAPSV